MVYFTVSVEWFQLCESLSLLYLNSVVYNFILALVDADYELNIEH